MALGKLGRLISRSPAPVDTGPQRSAEVCTDVAQVDTGAQQAPEVPPAEPQWQPLIVGTIHHPHERAVLLVQALIDAGYSGKSIYQGDLEVFHRILREQHGWAPVSWLAICREMKRIGLRKWTGYVDGERLTLYEIQPMTKPASNVVPHPASLDR